MSTQTVNQAFPVQTGTHPRLPKPSFPCKRSLPRTRYGEPIPGCQPSFP